MREEQRLRRPPICFRVPVFPPYIEHARPTTPETAGVIVLVISRQVAGMVLGATECATYGVDRDPDRYSACRSEAEGMLGGPKLHRGKTSATGCPQPDVCCRSSNFPPLWHHRRSMVSCRSDTITALLGEYGDEKS